MRTLTVALTSSLISDPAPITPTVWSALRGLVGTGVDAAELGNWARANLVEMDADRVLDRLEELDRVAEELQELEGAGIQAITEFDSLYPTLWKKRMKRYPPSVFVAGDPQLLSLKVIGVVGSRSIDQRGADFAQKVAEIAVAHDFGVVSGGAPGADQVAMTSAHEAGGRSIGILSDSMLKRSRDVETAETLASGRACLCSQFSPYAPFSAGNAMARNKLIYALSAGTVVVAASDGTGGTWAGATDAMELDLCPVFVWDIDLPGNQKLIERGGIRLESAEQLASLITKPPRLQPELEG